MNGFMCFSTKYLLKTYVTDPIPAHIVNYVIALRFRPILRPFDNFYNF